MRIANVVLLAALPALPALAQGDREPVFRITSQLVLVDAVVTRGGEFVEGLEKSDFQVYEDGRLQRIEFFAAPDTPLDSLRGGDLPPAVSNAFARDHNKVVVLVDSVTVDSNTLMRVREALREFFLRHRPQDEVMLAYVDPGLTVVQPLTRDWEAMIEAVEKIPLHASTRFDTVSLADLLARVEDNYRNVPRDRESVLGMALEQSVGQANDYLSMLEARVRLSASAISAVSGALRPFPGRKSIIQISGGFPLKPHPLLRKALTDLTMSYLGFAAEFESEVRGSISRTLSKVRRPDLHRHLSRAIHDANLAGVSVHTVDARGLVAVPAVGSAMHKGSMNLEVRGRDTLDAQMSDVVDAQNFLATLSVDTGGIFFQNRNDLLNGLSRAYRDMSRYYLLAYRPNTKRKEGRLHRIEVKVPGVDGQVRARRAYLELTSKERERSTLVNAVDHPGLYHAFPVSVQVQPTGKGKFQLDVSVPAKNLLFKPVGGEWVDKIEVYAVLKDGKGAWEAGKFKAMKNYDIRLNEQGYKAVLEQNIVSRSEVKAKPGEYTLIVVVKESPTGAIGTARREIVLGGGGAE